MRLHDEIGRIFAGVRQVENAIEAIQREEQGRLAIGVMPALGGSFIQRATSSFLKKHKTVSCSVQSVASQWIVEWLLARKLDIGVVGAAVANPYVRLEPFVEHPLVCAMPLGHPLTQKDEIYPHDLDGLPFINFHPDTYVGHKVGAMFSEYKVRPNIVLVSNAAPTISEFVAAGLGVSLLHPLMASGLEQRIAIRRFDPSIMDSFQLCWSADNRNAHLVEDFAEEVRAVAAQVSRVALG